MYVPADKLVGAEAGVAVKADPSSVHAYVNGASPPVNAIVAEPVDVLPHGRSSIASVT